MFISKINSIKTHSLGYPRIGARRELKRATEAYWKGVLTLEELLATGKTIREVNRKKQEAAGIELIPINDFSFYDQMLDMSCLLGNVPPRFKWTGGKTDVDTVFRIFSNNWLPAIIIRRLGLWLRRNLPVFKIFALKLMTGFLGRIPQLGSVN